MKAPALMRGLVFAVAAIGAAALAYLSLRPSPFITEVHWIPHGIGKWADHHGVVRNTVAFFVFGFFVFAFIGRRWPHFLALCAFSAAIEVPQIWLPRRTFDLEDISAGIEGLALAWLFVVIPRFIYSRLRAWSRD